MLRFTDPDLIGFLIEELLELQPPGESKTTYKDFVHRDWAERRPAEEIWRLRREGSVRLLRS